MKSCLLLLINRKKSVTHVLIAPPYILEYGSIPMLLLNPTNL